jgi:predicted glycosyltransferase
MALFLFPLPLYPLTLFPFSFMLIWIDLANSPHVPFFRALREEFEGRGHEVRVTARDFAQTVELAQSASLNPTVIGGFGGRALAGKAGNLISRAAALARWARTQKFNLAVSHNSYAQSAAARALSLRSVTLMDYEHQPANHLAFRLASRVIVPRAFPEDALSRYGAKRDKVRRYDGTKEDVYLADFAPDPRFAETLRGLGVEESDVLVVVRPPARDALYHRFDNELFDELLLRRLGARDDVKIILLPRTEAQRGEYASLERENMILPAHALDGANLIAAADLVISAGGTMNREAAALGVPAATIYAGRWAAIDEELVRQGRLKRISTREDLDALGIEKKKELRPRRALHVRAEVADLILDE